MKTKEGIEELDRLRIIGEQAKLIQMAVDMADYINDEVGTFPSVMAFRAAAKAAGFKPTEWE